MKSLDINWLISANHLTIKIGPNLLGPVPASDDLTKTEMQCIHKIWEYTDALEDEISNYFIALKEQEGSQ